MGRLAAIGGGTFEETDPLNQHIIKLSGKEKPNILFIGTAAEDSTNPLTSCKKSFKRVCPGVIVKKLSIIRSVYTEEETDELLSWADIIYVGGGNTEFLVKKWTEYGLIPKLRKIFEEDSAVISGMSAGAICWFTDGYTDSDMFGGREEWHYRLIRPGIDLYSAVFCPHYSDFGRHGFDEAIRETGKPGIAVDDCAAFVISGEREYAVSSKEGAGVYRLDYETGTLRKTAMDTEILQIC